MRICVLVKEVPDGAARRPIDPTSGSLDRSGERTLNRHDAHALEAAIRLREAPAVAVGQIVAITMGPESAARTLRRAISLGADRAVHLCDPALVGSDLLATGYALAQVLAREQPDLVLLGQQSEDGACSALGPLLAEYLGMPSLTQVTRLDIDNRRLRCERQAEYGFDTVELALPAVVAVGDAINEPRYPSLRTIMGAQRQPLEVVTAAEVGIDAERVGGDRAAARWSGSVEAPARAAGQIIEDADSDDAVAAVIGWLDARGLIR